MDDVVYLTEDFVPVDASDPRMVMVKVRQPDGKIVFGLPEKVQKNKLFIQTFEDHKGRPGLVGGSAPRKGSSPLDNKQLFHYTDEKSVESIKKGGFTVKQEGYSALLGRGVFFTDETGGDNFKKDFGKSRVEATVDVKNTLEIEGGYLGYFNWVLEEAERTGAPSPNPEDITNIVSAAGYDSVMIRGSSKGNIYIVFDPKDIKVKQNQQLFRFGGQGSGNFDHSGRPGLVGGSGRGFHTRETQLEILEELNSRIPKSSTHKFSPYGSLSKSKEHSENDIDIALEDTYKGKDEDRPYNPEERDPLEVAEEYFASRGFEIIDIPHLPYMSDVGIIRFVDKKNDRKVDLWFSR